LANGKIWARNALTDSFVLAATSSSQPVPEVYTKYHIDDISTGLITMIGLRRFPSMATFIVDIFVSIIVGAAGTFAYVVFLSDDRGQSGP